MTTEKPGFPGNGLALPEFYASESVWQRIYAADAIQRAIVELLSSEAELTLVDGLLVAQGMILGDLKRGLHAIK